MNMVVESINEGNLELCHLQKCHNDYKSRCEFVDPRLDTNAEEQLISLPYATSSFDLHFMLMGFLSVIIHFDPHIFLPRVT